VPKQIDKLKKELYKQSRLQGNSKAKSMIDAGYASSTAYKKASTASVVISSEQELMNEVKASDISVDWVISKLNAELQSIHAKSSDRVRILELLGKYLNMFKDNQVTQVSIFQGLSDKDLPPIDISQEVKP
jgi:hypothetical protein